MNSHVVYLYVAVVRGCDQELGVGGEGEGPDGHGVTWEGEREETRVLDSLQSLHVWLISAPAAFKDVPLM